MITASNISSIKQKANFSLFTKAFLAILACSALTLFCIFCLLRPVLHEDGFVANVSIELVQDMLSASLNGKSPQEVSNFLKSRHDPFLNNATLAPKRDLLATSAPLKFGLWLHDHEKLMLMQDMPFWTVKPKFLIKLEESSPNLQNALHSNSVITQLPNRIGNNVALTNKYRAEHKSLFSASPLPGNTDPSMRTSAPEGGFYPTYQDLVLITLNASRQGKFGRTSNGRRVSYGVIPIPGTDIVIFSRRPAPKSPEYSTASIILNTALLLFILIFIAFLLIYPFAKRIRAIENTCQKVSNGDYKARCFDCKEDSIGVLAQHIDEMTASIERHLSQQKSLLQAVSHELRTPLARIRFTIEMLDIPDDDEKSQARLESIDDDLTEIDNLIKELSYFNYVDAGKGKQHFEISAVKDLIEMTLRQRSLSTENFNVTTSEISENMMIEADPTAFKRVIGNLVSNAARYAKSEIHIDVSYTENNQFIQICVDDDGPGIPVEARSSVFEPFVCLEQSRSKSMSGCGLGLAIADRIMKVHAGSIEVLDSPLGGTRMCTQWPIKQSEPL